ncbi:MULTISPECIES: hypothetical protein [unclassified Streptomyces]|uniref:hypothetical protein n=1 Tax=unclassified Streptomyces TaxID=2593676 RepID=UPI000369F90D|nr:MULTISPECIES: hypothetical protein [unclassified Streptomyces]MYT32291.1 hypothetical protein [Streptomyces sp. SID8354]
MKRVYRLAVAAALSTAAVTGSAAAAVAAPAPGALVAAAHHPLHKIAKPAKVTVTAAANKHNIRAGQELRITGKVTGVRPGTKARLQQQDHRRWVNLPVTATTQKHGAYLLHVKPTHKGRTVYRVAAGGAVSHDVIVTVR